MDELSEAMTNREVAAEFHISPRTITRLQDEGVLPYWVPAGLTRPRLMWRRDVIDWRLGRLAPRGSGEGRRGATREMAASSRLEKGA